MRSQAIESNQLTPQDTKTLELINLFNGTLSKNPENKLVKLNDIEAETLNHIISVGPYKGESLAFHLSKSSLGRALLTQNNFHIANKISKQTLNTVIDNGLFKGQSVAFHLAYDNKGILLAHDNFRLGKLISKETLNTVIPEGSLKDHSVAFWLSFYDESQGFLSHDNYRLCKLISKESLNRVFSEGELKGLSTAFFLSKTERGAQLLVRDDCRMGKMISEEALNTVIDHGQLKGQSVAFHLAFSNERELLVRDDCRLGMMISKQTLNTVIDNGLFKDQSVAFHLAAGNVRELFAHDEFRLGKLISKQTLNTVIQEGPLKDQSIAFWLSLFEEEQGCLLHDNCLLGKLISEESLNKVISEGALKGLSTAFFLSNSKSGVNLMARDNCGLGKIISKETLNTVIPKGFYKGYSVAVKLSLLDKGRAILSHNKNFLGKLITERVLNTRVAFNNRKTLFKPTKSDSTGFSYLSESLIKNMLSNSGRVNILRTSRLIGEIPYPFDSGSDLKNRAQQELQFRSQARIQNSSNSKMSKTGITLFHQGERTKKPVTGIKVQVRRVKSEIPSSKQDSIPILQGKVFKRTEHPEDEAQNDSNVVIAEIVKIDKISTSVPMSGERRKFYYDEEGNSIPLVNPENVTIVCHGDSSNVQPPNNSLASCIGINDEKTGITKIPVTNQESITDDRSSGGESKGGPEKSLMSKSHIKLFTDLEKLEPAFSNLHDLPITEKYQESEDNNRSMV